MRTLIITLALLGAIATHGKMHVDRTRTFNASILNFGPREYAVDLENWRHGTSAYGYRVGDRLLLKGSQLDYNGVVTVYAITGDVLHVRYKRARSQRAEEAVRLRIQRLGRP